MSESTLPKVSGTFAGTVGGTANDSSAADALLSVRAQPEGILTKFGEGNAGARLEQVFVFVVRQCPFHFGEVQTQQVAQLGDVRYHQV